MQQDQDRKDRIETMAREIAGKSTVAMFSISRAIGADSVSPQLRKAFNDFGLSEAGIEAFFEAKHLASRTGGPEPKLTDFIDQKPGTPSTPKVVALSRRQP